MGKGSSQRHLNQSVMSQSSSDFVGCTHTHKSPRVMMWKRCIVSVLRPRYYDVLQLGWTMTLSFLPLRRHEFARTVTAGSDAKKYRIAVREPA